MNKTSIQENGSVILDGHELSNIEVMALFAQYREGNKESLTKEQLCVIIDLLLEEIKE